MTWVNVGCGPFRAPAPWVNLDVHRGDGVEPDVLVADAMFPLADYEPGTLERVYLGHVLEHVPWPDVDSFLQDVHRALAPGGEVCAVGPDVYRAIRLWKNGADPESWDLVESVLENFSFRTADGAELVERPAWVNARHWWNCYEDRLLWALRDLGLFVEVSAQPITPAALGSWPLVSYTQWQCAVVARK